MDSLLCLDTHLSLTTGHILDLDSGPSLKGTENCLGISMELTEGLESLGFTTVPSASLQHKVIYRIWKEKNTTAL